MSNSPIFVVNAGSSSLKFGLYATQDGEEQPVCEGLADGIGRGTGKIELNDAGGRVLRSESLTLKSHESAMAAATRLLGEIFPLQPCAIGHRVVHGGPRLVSHQRITPAVRAELRKCIHFAPLHIPIELELVAEAERSYPDVPQFACFDTAFHRSLPEVAARLPLPRELFDQGIRRYGFHGLSYESIVRQLGKDLPSRTVIAHLGSGASLAAVKDGQSIDTTMGFTPTGGIPMATRSGDLDPGVLLYLLRAKGMNADSLERLLNHSSGLLAISGGTADMRDLETAADGGSPEAQLAIEIFCISIRKAVAAYTAVLGGLEMLVFAGGIGEHSARVRTCICRGLEFLGVSVEEPKVEGPKNELHEATISARDSKVSVVIVAAQENRQIAQHCRALLKTSH